ncbi:MAG: polyprenyl synthetase family protein [Lachnospiraceae bacterium]|nr:polyprenyl synthetase family protein [Lachnospiraceae bacterium]
MDFQTQLKQKVEAIEQILEKYLPAEEGYQKTVLEAMNYSVRVGGKRLRPMLMQETYQMLGGNGDIVEPFMAAQEMIHTYSLVHDDLPAMDNDMYRRGKKTTHVLYGEAMAILAGDGLLNYAFETACKAFLLEPGNENIGKALTVLAGKAGIYGMIGGQVADVEAEKRGLALDEEKLMYIHEHKTAALIQSSFMIGAILAGAGAEDVKKLEKAAYNIGIAFQIQDDILDVTSTLEVLGKPIGSDEKNNKLTYVKAHGLEKAKEDVEKLSKEALEILQGMQNRNEFLEQLVVYLIHREK